MLPVKIERGKHRAPARRVGLAEQGVEIAERVIHAVRPRPLAFMLEPAVPVLGMHCGLPERDGRRLAGVGRGCPGPPPAWRGDRFRGEGARHYSTNPDRG